MFRLFFFQNGFVPYSDRALTDHKYLQRWMSILVSMFKHATQNIVHAITTNAMLDGVVIRVKKKVCVL